MLLRLRAAKIALQAHHQHVLEVGGNNRGPIVEKIIRYAKGIVGEPWCVDFVIWCYGHAGSTVVCPGFTRAVVYMPGIGTRTLKLVELRRGHILRFMFDHTGIFLGWRRLVRGRWVYAPYALATHARTVEGNTGAGGAESDSARGGDGVHIRYRPKQLIRDGLAVSS